MATKFRSSFAKTKRPLFQDGLASKRFAPTPSAPAQAPKPAPAPYDNQYEQTRATLTQNRDVALANVSADRTQTAQNYGFNFDGTENTTDPYSRLATLRADFEKIKRGSGTGYAARGQLYAGSYQNQVNSDQEGHNRGYDALRKDFTSQANALRDRETQIQSDYNTGLTQAGNQRIDAAAGAVAEGEAPVATAPTRRDAVLKALSGYLTPKTRKRLAAEARSNGWA